MKPFSLRLEPSGLHSRTLLATGLPINHPSDYAGLQITINYTGEGNACMGVALDHAVIPQIVRAVNSHAELVAALEAALLELEANKTAMQGPEWAAQRTATGGALGVVARALAHAKQI